MVTTPAIRPNTIAKATYTAYDRAYEAVSSPSPPHDLQSAQLLPLRGSRSSTIPPGDTEAQHPPRCNQILRAQYPSFQSATVTTLTSTTKAIHAAMMPINAAATHPCAASHCSQSRTRNAIRFKCMPSGEVDKPVSSAEPAGVRGWVLVWRFDLAARNRRLRCRTESLTRSCSQSMVV